MTFEYYVKEKEKIAYRSGEEIGRSEGIARGRSEGEQIGAAQKQREIAKNMKSLKISLDNIAEATGLSLAEIEAL